MTFEIKTQNPKIEQIVEKYSHYGHLKWDDIKAFNDYRDELHDQMDDIKFAIKYGHGNTDELTPKLNDLETECEEIDHFKKYKIYNSTLVSLYTMNGTLCHLWEQECSGYTNNAFYDFKDLCEQVNAYWEIENPHKAPNKIAYGWKFSMKKADMPNGYYSKSWKLYMWGCIKNYLVKNGVEFTKDESLKVRKIVGLADIVDTVE